MSWPVLKKNILIFWSFLKKYWKCLFFIVVTSVLMLIRRRPNFFEMFERIRTDHEAEVSVIEKNHKKVMEARGTADRRYDETIKQIEKNHESDIALLDSKKRREIKILIDNHADDPQEIAERLSKVTGFSIYIE